PKLPFGFASTLAVRFHLHSDVSVSSGIIEEIDATVAIPIAPYGRAVWKGVGAHDYLPCSQAFGFDEHIPLVVDPELVGNREGVHPHLYPTLRAAHLDVVSLGNVAPVLVHRTVALRP